MKILIIICSFTTMVSYAQKPKEVTIEGEAPFAANYQLRVITFSDYINFTPVTVASTQISKSGSFKLSFKISNIQLAQIEINTSKTELFIVPGYSYNLSLKMDEQLFKLFNPSDENGYIIVKSARLDTNDLNYKIGKFNASYETIFEKYGYNITRFKSILHYDSLITEVKEKYSIEYNPQNFYSSYIYYTIGQVEAIMNNKNPKYIFTKYFDNDFILYDNPAYMTLFNYFYDNYLYVSPRISKSVLDNVINEKCDYLSLFNAVGKDYTLVNEKLRELVIIKNLTQFIGNEEFNQENIIKLLNYIEKNSRFAEHQQIAKASLNQKVKLTTGSILPSFNFKYANGAKFNSKDFKDKWVYYHFFSTQCVDCIREMTIINELEKQHREKIEFVSVCVDPEETKFIQFRKNYPQFDWQFVHFNETYDLLKYLEINSLPDYLLISPDGKIYSRYPPAPDNNLPILLLQLLEDKEEEQNPLDPRND